jgi:hypothetical protein
MYVNMCVCIYIIRHWLACVHVCTCMHVCAYLICFWLACGHVCTCMHVCAYLYNTYIHAFSHTRKFKKVYRPVHEYVIHACICILVKQTCILVPHTHTRKCHTWTSAKFFFPVSYISENEWMYACMYANFSSQLLTYQKMNECMHACMYVCMQGPYLYKFQVLPSEARSHLYACICTYVRMHVVYIVAFVRQILPCARNHAACAYTRMYICVYLYISICTIYVTNIYTYYGTFGYMYASTIVAFVRQVLPWARNHAACMSGYMYASSIDRRKSWPGKYSIDRYVHVLTTLKYPEQIFHHLYVDGNKNLGRAALHILTHACTYKRGIFNKNSKHFHVERYRISGVLRFIFWHMHARTWHIQEDLHTCMSREIKICMCCTSYFDTCMHTHDIFKKIYTPACQQK